MSAKIMLYYLSIDQKLRHEGPKLIMAKEQELEKKYFIRALVIGRYYDAEKEEAPTETVEVLDFSIPTYNYGTTFGGNYIPTTTFPGVVVGDMTTTTGGNIPYNTIKW